MQKIAHAELFFESSQKGASKAIGPPKAIRLYQEHGEGGRVGLRLRCHGVVERAFGVARPAKKSRKHFHSEFQ